MYLFSEYFFNTNYHELIINFCKMDMKNYKTSSFVYLRVKIFE